MPFWKFWGDGQSVNADWGRAPRLALGEVVRLQAGSGDNGTVYLARVSALGLRRIFLGMDDRVPIPRQPLVLFFERGEALYHFETRIVGPARAGAIAVAWPRKIVRLQRRQFYRLLLERPTTFRVTGGGALTEPHAARLVNLSGGGALLAVGKPLPAGLVVTVRVPSEKTGELLPAEAEVLGCHVATQGTARVYFARLRFLRLSDADREAIIAFLHEQQRILLRTRKLLRA